MHTLKRKTATSAAWDQPIILFRYWLPPFLWMGLLFTLSGQPDLPSPTEPGSLADTLFWKSLHLAEYAVLTGLLWRAFARGVSSKIEPSAWSFAISFLFAASDEFHQTFVPGREGTFVDVVIDSVGAMLALWAIWRLRKTRTEERMTTSKGEL